MQVFDKLRYTGQKRLVVGWLVLYALVMAALLGDGLCRICAVFFPGSKIRVQKCDCTFFDFLVDRREMFAKPSPVGRGLGLLRFSERSEKVGEIVCFCLTW